MIDKTFSLKAKITIAMMRYSINDMLFVKGGINEELHKLKAREIVNDLYEVIAALEPKSESEVI